LGPQINNKNRSHDGIIASKFGTDLGVVVVLVREFKGEGEWLIARTIELVHEVIIFTGLEAWT
jgi:hypothetical protein